MTLAHVYELGMKAYLVGATLTDCPYDPANYSKAYDAWRDGWLDATRARWRRHALAVAAHRHAKPSLLAPDRPAHGDTGKPSARQICNNRENFGFLDPTVCLRDLTA